MVGGRSPTAYLELTKPRIVVLLLLVAFSSYIASAQSNVESGPLILLLASGALTSAGSSALNHYLDRDIDRLMKRTQHRPLPTKRLTPAQALLFGIVLVGAGFSLAFFINTLTVLFIALGAVFYVGVYTSLLKRRSAWNIVIGGFAGSCPALAGSAAAVNAVTLPALFIAILVFLWTPGHFWALSLRNKEDYRRAGIPMLPAVVDEHTAARTIVASTAVLPAYVLIFFGIQVLSLATVLLSLLTAVILVYLTVGILRDSRAAWPSFKFSGIFLAVTVLAVPLGPYLF